MTAPATSPSRPATAWLALAVMAATLLPAPPALADASLMVSPTRVVFEGDKRSAVITLLNNGTESGTYRLFLVRYRMTPQGSFEEVKTPAPGERFADDLVRFTPKQVVLPPKMTQQVRIQLRKPAGLEDGEYRSHLVFRALPTVPAAQAPDDKATGISIRLIPAIGVSIPLIVRQGKVSATAKLKDLAFVPASRVAGEPSPRPAQVSFRLERQGNGSLYGDLVATFRPKGGAAVEVGRTNGVAVYAPNAARASTMSLASGAKLAGGSLRLVYQSPPTEGGKPLADAEIALP